MFLTAKPVDETTTEYVEQNVRRRLERNELITRTDGALELRCILDEAAVRRMIGGPGVMREQFDEIVELSRLDNVTIQILPHAVVGYRAESNFAILDFGGVIDPYGGCPRRPVAQRARVPVRRGRAGLDPRRLAGLRPHDARRRDV